MFFGDTLENPDRDSSYLFTIAKPWKESEITWFNADHNTLWEDLDPDAKFFNTTTQDTVKHLGGTDFNPEIIGSALWGEYNTWEHFTCTEAMKTIIKNQNTFHGFMLKMRLSPFDEHIIFAGRNYYSSEYSEVDKRPKLTIEYATSSINSSYLKSGVLRGLRLINANGILKLFIPLYLNYQVSIHNIHGRQIYSFRDHGEKWFTLPIKLRPGMHIVKIKSPSVSYSRKLLITN